MAKQLFTSYPADFGRYVVLEQLGVGGMGEVYLAKDSSLGRKVALKIPRIQSSKKDRLLKGCRREAKLAAALDHPSLVRIFDVGENDGVHYMSMAYIDGKSLQAILKRKQKLTPQKASRLIKRLALALYQAHKAGVTHRDLKPSNIMISNEGRPIIVDFGLARPDFLFESSAELEDPELTRMGALVGTLSYMSPEQVKGKNESVGPFSDQFSLGVILYQLLSGRLPFRGEMGDVLGKIAHKSPKSLTEFGIDEELTSVCFRAMSKSPEERYASMKHFAKALDDWEKGVGSASVHAGAGQTNAGQTNAGQANAGQVGQAPAPDATDVSSLNIGGSSVVSESSVPLVVEQSSATTATSRRRGKRSTNKMIIMSWVVNAAMMIGAIAALYLSKDYFMALLEPRKQVVVQQETAAPAPKRQRITKPDQPVKQKAPTQQRRTVDPTAARERSWRGVFNSLPDNIALNEAPGTLRISRAPFAAIPWDIKIDSRFANLKDGQTLMVAKHESAPEWAIQLQRPNEANLSLVEFDLSNGRLDIRKVAPSDAPYAMDSLLAALEISYQDQQKRLRLLPKQPQPLEIDLTELESSIIVLSGASEDSIQLRIDSFDVDEAAWMSDLKTSNHWKKGGAHWSEAVDYVATRILPKISEQTKGMSMVADEEQQVDIEGPIPLRFTFRCETKDGAMNLFCRIESKDKAKWRRFNPERDGSRFMDLLSNYAGNFQQGVECANNMQITGQKIAKIQQQLAAIPKNSVSISDATLRRQLSVQLTGANQYAQKLRGRARRLETSVKRQKQQLQEQGYLHAIATALHKHASVNYCAFMLSSDEKEEIVVQSQPKFQTRGAFGSLR